MKLYLVYLIFGIVAIGLCPSELAAEDFRMLLVRESGVKQTAGMPSGRVVINGGYLAGVEVGQSGVIWRKNKFKGQIEIADLEVVAVGPYDATGTYVMRHPDFQVLKKDRASIETTEHAETDILAEAMNALNEQRCFDALLLYEKIVCSNLDNGFVMAQVDDCLHRVKSRLSGTTEPQQVASGALTPWEMVELAEGHRKHANLLAADMYLKCSEASGRIPKRLAELRPQVRNYDLAFLLSAERCGGAPAPTQSESDRGGAPGPNEFVPVDVIAEMMYYETPDYPRIAKQSGSEGKVWIKALISSEGEVKDATLYKTSGHTSLDEAALEAASKCRFKPALMDGKPVAMWVTYAVNFKL